MKRIITILAALLVAFSVVVPAMADSITLSPGASINNNSAAGGDGGAGGSASATGGSVGNISNNGGTHVQTNTQLNTQVNTQTTVQGQEQGQGQAQHQRQQQQQKQQANNEGVNVSTDVPRMAPPAVPAALAVSSLTCYGSWSIAASTPFGGVGAGFPTKDADCERARNALIFVNLGMQQVALALLSQNPDNAKAMQAAGVKYPGQVATTAAPVVASIAVASPVVATTVEPESKCGKGMVVTPSGFCRWAK